MTSQGSAYHRLRRALDRGNVRWHVRFVNDFPNVDLRESVAVLALLGAIPANPLAALALAELLSRRRGLERPCETLVAWAASVQLATVPTALDNGRRSPKTLLRSVVARLLGSAL